MKFLHLIQQPYKLPFRTPWHTSRGSLHYRHGFIIQLQAKNGLCGLGDCAPMPEMGTENLQEAMQQCQKLSALIASEKLDFYQTLAITKELSPAISMAVETALLDIQSQQQQLPLHKLFNPTANNSCKVNINLGCIDENLLNKCERAIQKGFKTLKIKMGVASPIYEIEKLEQLFDKYRNQNIKWRLDANQAWNREQALEIIRALNGFANNSIEYLEEPLQTPTLSQLANIQEQTNFPLAIDESIKHFNLDKIIQTKVLKHIILKATLIGGLSKTYDIYEKLNDANIKTTLTSLLESAVGIHANLHLACAVDNNISHGLLSGEYFQYDLYTSPRLNKQQMYTEPRKGLGITANNLEFNHVSFSS